MWSPKRTASEAVSTAAAASEQTVGGEGEESSSQRTMSLPSPAKEAMPPKKEATEVLPGSASSLLPAATAVGGVATPPTTPAAVPPTVLALPESPAVSKQHKQQEQEQEAAVEEVQTAALEAKRAEASEGRQGSSCYPFQNGPTALLFLGHTALLLWMALGRGLQSLNDYAYETERGVSYPAAGLDADVLRAIQGLSLALCAGGGYAFLWALLLLAAPDRLSSITYHAALLSCAAGVGIAGWLNAWGLVAVGTATVVGHIGYNYCMAERRPFANGTFVVAAKAVLGRPSALAVALLTAAVQLAWILCWAVAAYGWAVTRSHAYVKIGDVVFPDPEDSCIQDPSLAQCTCVEVRQGSNFVVTGQDSCENLKAYDTHIHYPTLLPLLLSLAWGAHLLKHLASFSAAAAVSHWWHNNPRRFPAFAALAKGLCTSFGSLCLSALVVVVLRVVRLFVFVPMPPQRRAWEAAHEGSPAPPKTITNSPTVFGVGLEYDPQAKTRKIALSVAARGMMQLLALWGRFTVVYCGLASSSTVSPADDDEKSSESPAPLNLMRAVDRLADDVFVQTGGNGTGLADAAVNDLGEGSLRALSLAIGVTTGVAAVGFGQAYLLDTTALQVLAAIGFLGGFFMGMTVLAALDAAWAAVVVKAVTEPEALKAAHPREAEKLKGVWQREGLRLGRQGPKRGRDVEAAAADAACP